MQQKIDSGVYSWVQLQQQWGSATLPHELMASRAEIPVKAKFEGIGRGAATVKVAKTGKKDDDDEEKKKKQVCYSWNNSEIKGKRKWEIDHEGETCIRMHICSWCKSKENKHHTHQKSFCRKRIEEDGE